MLMPVLPLYLVSIGQTPAFIGLSILAFNGASLATRPWIGYSVDRWSPRGTNTLGGLILGVASFFLAAPSMEELERRLTTRKTESPEQMAIRIETARDEVKQSDWFDAIVVNETDALEETVEQIVEVIRKQQGRSPRKPVGL